jgi:hypothetical protein
MARSNDGAQARATKAVARSRWRGWRGGAVAALATAALALGAPAAAQAHCPNPNGWEHISSDGGAWAQGYEYGTSQVAWFSAGQSVYALPYDGTWDWAYGTAWMQTSAGWQQHTGWHFILYHYIECP